MLFIYYLYGLYALNSSETAIEFSSHNAERLRTSVLGHGFHWLLLACKLSIHGHGYKQYKYHSLVVSFHPVGTCSAPSGFVCQLPSCVCLSALISLDLVLLLCQYSAKNKSRVSLAFVSCSVQSRNFTALERATQMYLLNLLGYFFIVAAH